MRTTYLVFLVDLVAVKANLFTGNLDILEDGHSYRQSITYDSDDSTLMISVPAHNDKDASIVILHHSSVRWFGFYYLE